MNTHPIKHPLTKDAPVATEMPRSGQKYFNQNYTGMNFSKRDLRRCTFMRCTFDNADMSDSDCTGTEFYASTFRNTNCRNVNFTNAKLHGTVFEPSDFYGMTMTFTCETYQDMLISKPVWLGYVFFALGLMIPPKDDDGFDPRAALITALGREFFLEHFEKFKARTL